MDKLKKMFHHDKSSDNNSASKDAAHPPATTSATGATSAGVGTDDNGVILHTTLGDITIALYNDKVPKVHQSLPTTPCLS